ncbi:MAG: multicopper oxidase domain-containing protein [Pseudomonadota bacterium]
MERRSFIKLGGASLASAVLGSGLLSWVPRSEAATISKTFYITGGTLTMPDGVGVYFKGFSNSATGLNVPAASIICQEGDTLSITVVNKLAVTHNFVIGGLKAGDPPLASTGDILSGASKTLTYTIPTGKAGSYLFYDNKTSYNVFLGLHGGLAIMPAGKSNQLYSGSPTFVKQQFWIFNDIDPALNSAVQRNTVVPTTFTPRYFTINGLTSLPPGAVGHGDPTRDALYDTRTRLAGFVGDRTLVRMLSAGMCSHAVHAHGNHFEWLTDRGTVRSSVWKKDTLYLRNKLGKIDAIFPFEAPPDAYPPTTHGHFPMHLHDEMSQTAGGGMYQFGSMTEIEFL